jgi:hypothetical protein
MKTKASLWSSKHHAAKYGKGTLHARTPVTFPDGRQRRYPPNPRGGLGVHRNTRAQAGNRFGTSDAEAALYQNLSRTLSSQAKVLTGGGDLREAQVDVPLSVSHTCD